MFYVYMLTDPRKDNAPFYVGKGKGYRAFNHGKERTIYNEFKENTINAIRADGLQHGVVIVKENLSEDEAFAHERELIEQFGRRGLDNNGLLTNRTLGGEGSSGRINSPEHNAAIVVANTGNTYCVGKQHTNETKAKISKSNTGKKRSAETKMKLSESHKGLVQSEETVSKRIAKLKGIVRSAETRKKGSDAKLGEKNPMFGKPSPNRGKAMSEEQKQKLRDKNLGKKDSVETRKKKSDAIKAAYARRRLETGEHDG